MNWPEVKLLLILGAMLILPGWAFLSVKQTWKRWSVLQRWILATGLSISFYPTLFYIARFLLPALQIGPNKLLALLAVFCAVIVYGQRKSWKEQFSFDGIERIAILVFGVTIFTRLWVAHGNPYPAWADSLHHILLTQLVAANGALPYTLDPYEPSSLQMYHLGLYAISGTAQMLSGSAATTALLWTAQLLNGLAGLGTYLVLDRLIGRKGALVSAVVVGFVSYQPAWYFNWGRFPQVASQTVLLIAWIATLDTVACWERARGFLEKSLLIIVPGLINAGVFLLHFRVAGLYLLLLGISLGWDLYQAAQSKRVRAVLVSLLAIGIVACLLVLPALLPSLNAYARGVSSMSVEPTVANSTFSLDYYDYTINTFTLGAQPWLLIMALTALVVGLLHRDKLSLQMLLWLAALWVIGNAYRVGWYWLSFINYSGIIIMFYLPIAVTLGAVVEVCIARYSILQQQGILRLGLEILLFLGIIFSYARVNDIEAFRFFMTQSDERAMGWINKNLPKDAVFAINTYLWMGKVPHGTDGGYWIPYYTNRRTTTGTMMFTAAPENYKNQVLAWSKLAVNLNDEPSNAALLCAEGVKYAFIGKMGSFTQKGLDASRIAYQGTKILYQRDGISIISLCGQ